MAALVAAADAAPAAMTVAAPARVVAAAAAAAAAGALAAAAAAAAAAQAPDVALVQARARLRDPLSAQPATEKTYQKSLPAAVVAERMRTEATTAIANVYETAVAICVADRGQSLQDSHRSNGEDAHSRGVPWCVVARMQKQLVADCYKSVDSRNGNG